MTSGVVVGGPTTGAAERANGTTEGLRVDQACLGLTDGARPSHLREGRE